MLALVASSVNLTEEDSANPQIAKFLSMTLNQADASDIKSSPKDKDLYTTQRFGIDDAELEDLDEDDFDNEFDAEFYDNILNQWDEEIQ